MAINHLHYLPHVERWYAEFVKNEIENGRGIPNPWPNLSQEIKDAMAFMIWRATQEADIRSSDNGKSLLSSWSD